ncbi:MAG: DUF2085 domain-containing protein [Planctomycetes bacterium]|nr:DUF2085 domain-containing protein [Planctomycetota bacterium]MBE3097231.1 DUF2085 domain-containing protein [Planctomycetota bacterium]
MLTEFFSHVCGQGRAFVLDGEALPLCQRCLGLYAGAALTGLWILATGLWRRALPERSAAYANIVMLLAAMAGGVHWLDAGPTWRLVCGLWTGHVAMLWLTGGAGHLLRLAGREPFEDPPWPRGLRVQALAAGPVLAMLAVAFTQFLSTGWPVAAALVVAGAMFLALALVRAIIGVAWWAVSSFLLHAPVVANR